MNLIDRYKLWKERRRYNAYRREINRVCEALEAGEDIYCGWKGGFAWTVKKWWNSLKTTVLM
jgi:hypothetical protein